MLPRTLPELEGVRFGAALRPSLHLAGDFYNVFRLDRDRLGIYLGDVMGHGPAAALLGVFAMQGLRTKRIEGSLYQILRPSEVLANLSTDLMEADFPGNPFVTMIYGVLDTSRSTLTYSCGGHPPALLLRPGQEPSLMHGVGPLLGIFDAPFEDRRATLRSGDRVVLYSDGVESVSWGEAGPGVIGLSRILNVRDGRAPQELVDDAMDLACREEGPIDDLTMVMVEMR
jgi:sigma-B regulation protein RsbU (phosphoserine phosphatase)